jgi:hypothetical protein
MQEILIHALGEYTERQPDDSHVFRSKQFAQTHIVGNEGSHNTSSSTGLGKPVAPDSELSFHMKNKEQYSRNLSSKLGGSQQNEGNRQQRKQGDETPVLSQGGN